VSDLGGRALRRLFGLGVGLALLAGCAVTPPVPPSVSPSVIASSAVPSEPSQSPTAEVPLGEVAKDPQSTLSVNPIDFGGSAVVEAQFSDVIEGRTVSLQSKTDGAWAEVSSGTLDDQGRVEFTTTSGNLTYRAVALPYDSDGLVLDASATGEASAKSQWKLVHSDDFTGSRLKSPWAVRFPGLYYPSRWCSGVNASQVKLSDGTLRLGVAKVSAAKAAKVKAAAAKATKVPLAQACPHGVYDNGMVSTEGRYAFTYGTVAVRMKFPYQRGMHSSAWLQTSDGSDIEIDFIESFGYQSKWGIQNMLHPKSSAGERLDVGHYPDNVPGRKDRAWWDEYHVVSVEWSRTGYVFRLDGVETFRTSKALTKRPHFLVLSLLSSDYETDRLKPDQLPASADIDWVKVWQQR